MHPSPRVGVCGKIRTAFTLDRWHSSHFLASVSFHHCSRRCLHLLDTRKRFKFWRRLPEVCVRSSRVWLPREETTTAPRGASGVPRAAACIAFRLLCVFSSRRGARVAGRALVAGRLRSARGAPAPLFPISRELCGGLRCPSRDGAAEAGGADDGDAPRGDEGA